MSHSKSRVQLSMSLYKYKIYLNANLNALSAGQSEPAGLFGRRGFVETGTQSQRFRQPGTRGTAIKFRM